MKIDEMDWNQAATEAKSCERCMYLAKSIPPSSKPILHCDKVIGHATPPDGHPWVLHAPFNGPFARAYIKTIRQTGVANEIVNGMTYDMLA